MYGFKPLTTPGFGGQSPTRSPQVCNFPLSSTEPQSNLISFKNLQVYASQGQFQPPAKLMFGFSPVSGVGGGVVGNTPSYSQSSRPPPPPSVPFYAGAPRPGPVPIATNQG